MILDLGVASTGGFSVLPPSQHTLSKQMMKKWEVWEENIDKDTNNRMLEQMALHAPQVIRATSTKDLETNPAAMIR